MARILDFADGFTSAAEPTQGSVPFAGNKYQSFANDTAFETDKGSAGAAGDVYFNTTVSAVRYHDGVSWKSVVNESIPVLAGDILDANGAEQLAFTSVASAVNELDVKNAATGTNPGITAQGNDANVGIDYTPKGSGEHIFGGTSAAKLPSGTTAQRPATPASGHQRHNSTTGNLEGYDGNLWVELGIPLLKFGTTNLSIRAATTTNANDSVKITSADGTALSSSNPGWVVMRGTAGEPVRFKVTSDVTFDLTAIHGGLDTFGDRSKYPLHIHSLNDAGSLKWSVGFINGLNRILGTNDETVQANVSSIEKVLVNSALSGDSPAMECFWFKADFDDTGGLAENLWSVGTALGDLNTGPSGLISKPFHMVIDGSTTAPTKATTIDQEIAIWSKSGDSFFVTYVYDHSVATGTAAGSGTYLFKMPSGLVIDTNKIGSSTTTVNGVCGSAFVQTGDTGEGSLSVYDSTSLVMVPGTDTNNAAFIASTYFPITAAAVVYSFEGKVPIVGWD